MGGWHVVGYGFNAELRGMEQILPFQDKDRVAGVLRHQALPFAPGVWHGPEHVKPGHDTNLNRYFHRPEPIRAMAAEGLPGEIIAGRRPSMATLVGGG